MIPATKLMRACPVILLLLGLTCLPGTPAALAQQEAQPQEAQPQAKTFPGLNEVVPQATALASKLTVANTHIQELGDRQALYDKLDALQEDHTRLEEQHQDWETIDDWQINRLLIAQANYNDLADSLRSNLDVINNQLQTLENQRITWEQEKIYWQEWQEHLQQGDIKLPVQVFKRSRSSIDDLLQSISQISSELVRAQQKYASTQEILASRLNTIDETLDHLRKDTFRRNAIRMFEADYYRQFDRDLFAEFTGSLTISLTLPDNFVARHGDVIGLYLLSIIIITLLFVYRNRQSESLSAEWAFLFKRPLAGAIFISIVIISLFTDLDANLPLLFKWLLYVFITIAAMRLLNAFYVSPGVKKAIRTIAVVSIVTESLRYFGLPTPLMQLYNALLCAIAIPVCWQRIRRPDKEKISQQRVWAYLLLGVALIGLTAVVIGFENFTTTLIDSTLTTFIILILVKMVLHLSDRGIEALMQTKWVRNRHFMQVLGVEAGTSKLQLLLKILILANTAVALLVTWKLFDNSTEASEAILGFEYTVGEISISIRMVVMVVVVLYLTTIISWVVQAFVDSQIMTPRKMDIGVKESLKRLTHYGLFTIGFLIAVSMAGLGLQNFSIIVGALGVGIGFGLQNIVNNFISGIILLFERPIRTGDWIVVGNTEGYVRKISIRSTQIETFDHADVIVPNSELISNQVTNWMLSDPWGRVIVPVGVAYGSDVEKVREVLLHAARQHPLVIGDGTRVSAPKVLFRGFGDSALNFELRFFIRIVDQRLATVSDLNFAIEKGLREANIEIPFPQRDLHLRSVDSGVGWGDK